MSDYENKDTGTENGGRGDTSAVNSKHSGNVENDNKHTKHMMHRILFHIVDIFFRLFDL